MKVERLIIKAHVNGLFIAYASQSIPLFLTL